MLDKLKKYLEETPKEKILADLEKAKERDKVCFTVEDFANFYDKEGWENLGEDDGQGSYCCGKRQVEIGNTFTCLKCGGWGYSSS